MALPVSIIVVSYETRDATLACVASLLQHTECAELIVVDNASSDGTAASVRDAFPSVRVLTRADNEGFAKAANVGAGASHNPYLFFVNSDCLAEAGCVDELVGTLTLTPDAAAAVPRVHFPDGTVQQNAARLPTLKSIASEYLLGHVGDPYHLAELEGPREIESCSGAAVLIRRDDFLAVGGFDERYFMYVEDVELCRRLRERGRGICYVPAARMVHEGGLSSRPRAESLGLMLERNRRDYVRRTMPPVRRAAALATMSVGRRVAPARTRLLSLARPAARPQEDILSNEQVGQRVVVGGAQRAAAFVTANLITVAGAVVLLRYLGVDDFGKYGTVLALVGVVQGISDAGLTATGTRELALCTTDAERRDVLAHVLGLRVALTGIGVLCAVLFAVVAGYESDLVLGTVLAGIGVFLTSLQTAMLLPLGVELRNGAIAVVEVARQAVLVTAFAALAIVGAGLVPFFAAQILVGVVLLAITPVLLHSRHLVGPRWTPARIRSLATIALPVAVATVLGVLYLRVLVVLMSVISDQQDEIGYFVTSTRVFEVVGGLPFLISAVVLPVLSVVARDDRERLSRMTRRIVQVSALGGILVALVLWTLAEPLVVTLGGAEYEPAAPVLQIQCFAAITVFITAAWQPALFGLGHVKSLAVAMVIGITGVVLTGVLLIPPLQAQGAAIAAVVGDVALCLAVFLALRRADPGPWIPAAATLRIALAAALAAVVGLVPGVPDGVRAIAVVGVFTLAALMLRTLPVELTDAARSTKLWPARR